MKRQTTTAAPHRNLELAGRYIVANGLLHRTAPGESLALMQESWLTYPQILALTMLRNFGPLTIGDIAHRLNLSCAATSHLVERLVRRKLVARKEGLHDRRQKDVSISDKGLALVGKLEGARRQAISQAIALLPSKLQESFSLVLQQILDYLQPLNSSASSPSVGAAERTNEG